MKAMRFAAIAVVMASPAVSAAGLTGNVGVVSDYMFRGLDQSADGAAVQGGFDYAFDSGFYTGLWVSNAALAGGNEADAYLGYGVELGAVKVDVGAIYYAFTEDTENGTDPNLDYAELYLGAVAGPVSVKLFYAPEFGLDTGDLVSGDPDKNEMLYFSAAAELPLGDTLSLVPQVGFTAGDGAKDAFGDEYLDYSLNVTKKLENEWSVSLALVGTDLEPGADSDNPKFVIGIRKVFRI